MKLRQISLRTTYKSIFAEKFNPESWIVPELYMTFLKDYSTPLVQHINIFISDDWNNSLTSPMEVSGFREAFIDFDFKKYFELNNFNKKKMQLEAVHMGIMQIAQNENWEINPLVDAYNSCLKENLEFKIFIKDKFKTSPNKQHSIGIWCEWDIDFCKVFWVLRDRNKTEIKRHLLTNVKSFEGVFIYYLDWKWLNDFTIEVLDKYKYSNNLNWEIKI